MKKVPLTPSSEADTCKWCGDPLAQARKHQANRWATKHFCSARCGAQFADVFAEAGYALGRSKQIIKSKGTDP